MENNNVQQNTPPVPQLCRLSPVQTVILGVLTVICGAASATGYATVLLFVAACAAFALLIISERSFLAYIPVPVTYIAAVLLTGSPFTALISLIFVPVSFVYRVCFAKKCSLSVTVVAATVCIALFSALGFAAFLISGYGSIRDGFDAVTHGFSASVDSLFAQLNSIAEMTGKTEQFFTDEMISYFKTEIIMSSPAIVIVFCEITAYVTEKLIHLYVRIFSCSWVYANYPMRVTLSVPSAVIFLVSYFCSLFGGIDILYYSAENLMMMFLPFAAIAGIHSIFGKDGPIRRKNGGFAKIMIIILCVMAFTMSPIMLFMLFGVWGSVSTVSKAVIARMMRGDDGKGE